MKPTSIRLTMAENPNYWNTIATVIPVIALTYATALKRGDWHRMKAATRRWIALYGACLVTSLVWVESMALDHLHERTSDGHDEQTAFIIVGWAAAQVLAVPIAPLLVLAVHDLHPKILRAKRSQKADERAVAGIRKDYAAIKDDIGLRIAEYRLEGTEQVLENPDLVYDSSGAVRVGYVDRVPRWADARDFRTGTDDAVERLAQKLLVAEKQLKKSRKKLLKVLRSLTKKTAQLTDLHR